MRTTRFCCHSTDGRRDVNYSNGTCLKWNEPVNCVYNLAPYWLEIDVKLWGSLEKKKSFWFKNLALGCKVSSFHTASLFLSVLISNHTWLNHMGLFVCRHKIENNLMHPTLLSLDSDFGRNTVYLFACVNCLHLFESVRSMCSEHFVMNVNRVCFMGHYCCDVTVRVTRLLGLFDRVSLTVSDYFLVSLRCSEQSPFLTRSSLQNGFSDWSCRLPFPSPFLFWFLSLLFLWLSGSSQLLLRLWQHSKNALRSFGHIFSCKFKMEIYWWIWP